VSDDLALGREGYLHWPATIETLSTIAAAAIPVTLVAARRGVSGRLTLTAEGDETHLAIDSHPCLAIRTEQFRGGWLSRSTRHRWIVDLDLGERRTAQIRVPADQSS
jgi:hypothetical protein